MKTILIPTDFSTASLQLIEETILYFKPDSINIILFHAFSMPQSLQDITGHDSRPHLRVMNEPFRKACKRIKDKYGAHVYNITYRHMYGNTVSVFKHYLQFNKIDSIVFPAHYHLQLIHDRSVDPEYMINQCNYPVITSLLSDSLLPHNITLVNKNGSLVTRNLVSNQ
jgi:hypothetical protein